MEMAVQPKLALMNHTLMSKYVEDTTDTDILSSVHDPKTKSVTGKNEAQKTIIPDTQQYKVTMYAEIHKEATSPKFQPSVVLTDYGDICSDISMHSIDSPDNRTIAVKFNYTVY